MFISKHIPMDLWVFLLHFWWKSKYFRFGPNEDFIFISVQLVIER